MGSWCHGSRTQRRAAHRSTRCDSVPTGVRGLGSTSRAGRWGLDASATYVDHGNDGIVRGVQVEDQGGLRVIDEILAVDGLSALFIGTGDLSLSSGLPAAHPDNDALIANTLESCRAAKHPVRNRRRRCGCGTRRCRARLPVRHGFQ